MASFMFRAFCYRFSFFMIIAATLFIALPYGNSMAASHDPLVQVSPESVDLSKDVMTMTPESSARYRYFSFLKPMTGAAAPDFILESLSGDAVSLSSFVGERPVLLIFGSASCFVFRRNAMAFSELLRKNLQNKIEVFVVYTLEAHPAAENSPYVNGQWTSQANVEDKVLVKQPTNMSERLALANALAKRYDLTKDKILVDTMDNAVWKAYGGMPNAAYLIDKKGKVFFKERWTGQSQDKDIATSQLKLALEALLNQQQDQ